MICVTVKENYCIRTLMEYVFPHKFCHCRANCEILQYSGKKVYDGTYGSESDVEFAMFFPSGNNIEYEE